MNLREFIDKRLKELGKNRSYLVNECEIEWSTLSNIDKGCSIRQVTQQKLALALHCSQGEIQFCLAEQNPLKDVVVSNVAKAKMKANRKKKEPKEEPEEELPFGDLPEPEEGEDMKWYTEVPKDEPEPKKVKVKPAVVSVDVPIPEQTQKAMDKVHEAEALLDEATEELEIPALYRKSVEALKEIAGQTATPSDNVNHPAHYTQGGIECIEAIKASMTEEEFRGYLKGCQIKYLWRYRLKNGVEDLKKASWYLNRLIVELGGE